MSDQSTERHAALRAGRRLAYRAVGPADGALVLYLHGAIGSPQCVEPELEAVTHDLGIRYVMVSRPGFGGSDPAPGRTVLDFAADAAALADELGHERFAVVGVSAGGPYALGCAHELPERVAVAVVVSCMAPGCCTAAGLPLPVRLGLRALRARPRTCGRAGDALIAIARRHPRAVMHVIRTGAAPADQRLLADSEAAEGAAVRFLAAASGGVAGMIDDHLVCTRPWGFAPEQVRGLVHLWHGMQDELVPVDQAMHLVAALPRVQAALHPDEGHFFYRRRLREILGELVVAIEPRGPAVRSAGPPAGSGSR
jgi:pimeloyl-ACP methyl ester carboxylesterase